jgi:transcriptional regulator with XRE-family HTH domain
MARIKVSGKNVIGPLVNKFRNGLGISQEELAARCQRLGWDIARDTITRIEGGNRLVADYELFLLAAALKIPPALLLPGRINVKDFIAG